MAPKTRKITFSQEQIFFFHQDLLVLILVSYWKSQFFPLPSIDMGCITCFTSPNKSFINSLANRRLPCKSEKMNYKFKKKTCIGQANLVLLCLWLQKIDLSGGFPCMLLVVFSILRIWHFLVVFFAFHIFFSLSRKYYYKIPANCSILGPFFPNASLPSTVRECILSDQQMRTESWSGAHVFELWHLHCKIEPAHWHCSSFSVHELFNSRLGPLECNKASHQMRA